ncbi:MAG: hypothetical protein IJT21_07595 [Synergistaceae bacterium]|nr:hypothetical protein [Synergistaceae bacterium]
MRNLELENYIANRFVRQENISDDEIFILTWQNWLETLSPCEIINECICSKRPVKFISSDDISVKIYDSFAGKIPVITFSNASDFESFITNLLYNGERPENISQMGASFISGKMQRFLALTKKFYSNIEPAYVGLTPGDWREKSMIIRREHELTHYYTKKFYGSASNNLHDELIADFIGIYAAFEKYSAKLFCHFMGVDGSHEGRFSLYTEGLSDSTKLELAKIACQCANFLEGWSNSRNFSQLNTSSRINYLCELGINGILNLL